LNKRFSWKAPGGAPPPKPPQEIMPDEQSMADLGDDPMEAPEARPELADDRIGKHSMGDMLPRGEMATIDTLLDRYLDMKRTHGPEAAKAWFDRYRTAEFESAVSAVVSRLLEADSDDADTKKRWARHFAEIEKTHIWKSNERQRQAPKREYSKGPVPKRSTS